jgi:hypothetical protein
MSLPTMESLLIFLTETWNQYEKQAKAKLHANKRQDGPTHFRLLPLALGVTATHFSIWSVIHTLVFDPYLGISTTP